MTDLARRRLRHDIRTVARENLHNDGIYINVDAKDPFLVRALIVGPESTPYQWGYYFFDLRFSATEYPHVPPKVRFLTTDDFLRFNPNLYTKHSNGKVCLSILNTWTGEQWTSCQSLKSVLLSLLTSVLTAEPLQNEPGYQTGSVATDHRHAQYHRMVEHENFRFAIMRMVEAPPSGFEVFMPLMREKFLANYARIARALEGRQGGGGGEPTTEKSAVYRTMEVAYQYEALAAAARAMCTWLGGCPDGLVAEGARAAAAAAALAAAHSGAAARAAVRAVLSASGAVEEVVRYKAPPPSAAPKRQRRSRPPCAASGFADGHTVVVLESASQLQWSVYTDKRGAKRWRLVGEEAVS